MLTKSKILLTTAIVCIAGALTNTGVMPDWCNLITLMLIVMVITC